MDNIDNKQIPKIEIAKKRRKQPKKNKEPEIKKEFQVIICYDDLIIEI